MFNFIFDWRNADKNDDHTTTFTHTQQTAASTAEVCDDGKTNIQKFLPLFNARNGMMQWIWISGEWASKKSRERGKEWRNGREDQKPVYATWTLWIGLVECSNVNSFMRQKRKQRPIDRKSETKKNRNAMEKMNMLIQKKSYTHTRKIRTGGKQNSEQIKYQAFLCNQT